MYTVAAKFTISNFLKLEDDFGFSHQLDAVRDGNPLTHQQVSIYFDFLNEHC